MIFPNGPDTDFTPQEPERIVRAGERLAQEFADGGSR